MRKSRLEELKKKLSPQEYSSYLEKIEIKDVSLVSVNCQLHAKDFKGPAKLTYAEKPAVSDITEDFAVVRIEYEIAAVTDKSRIFDLAASYEVVMQTAEKIPGEFFEIYNYASLPLQTFPFLREFANSMISRMGLPPLLLPLRKYLVGKN